MSAKPGLYHWKEADVQQLIQTRVENNLWFTGKRGAGKIAWARVARLLDCGATGEQCEKKWLYLVDKYKKIIAPKTGVSLEGKEHDAETWPFFVEMSEFMNSLHSINPLELIDSTSIPSTSGSETPGSSGNLNHTTEIVINNPKKMKTGTVPAKAATLELLAKMDAQIDMNNALIERSLNEQAEARRNERAMLEILNQYFAS